jgi:hypothetical protein
MPALRCQDDASTAPTSRNEGFDGHFEDPWRTVMILVASSEEMWQRLVRIPVPGS